MTKFTHVTKLAPLLTDTSTKRHFADCPFCFKRVYALPIDHKAKCPHMRELVQGALGEGVNVVFKGVAER